MIYLDDTLTEHELRDAAEAQRDARTVARYREMWAREEVVEYASFDPYGGYSAAYFVGYAPAWLNDIAGAGQTRPANRLVYVRSLSGGRPFLVHESQLRPSRAPEVMARVTRLMLARVNRTGWPEHPGKAQPWDINRGRCVEWAELVARHVPGAVMCEWDDAETGMLHTFVYYAGRYYDAECHEGAADVTGLPCFRHPFPRPADYCAGAAEPAEPAEPTPAKLSRKDRRRARREAKLHVCRTWPA